MAAPAVLAEQLSKTFLVAEKDPGFAGTLRHFVRRRYRRIEAVRGVNFEIAPGEVVGFLGPNGAGKTTTLKMLTGLVQPTSGRARVLGRDPYRREAALLRSLTLVMGNKQQLIWDLPVLDSLRVNAAVYEIPWAEAERRTAELAEMLGVADVLRQPVRKLSLGERMKAELLASLLHRPRVLFLDEPTLGLDVNAQLAVRRFLKAYRERYGATLLLTSHYMADIEALAERVIVIHEGRLLYDGPLGGLVERFAPFKEVRLVLARPAAAAAFARYGEVEEAGGLRVRLLVEKERLTAVVAELLANFELRDLSVDEPPLEEVIGRVFAKGAV
ncbi:ABC transporter related protein [Oceanithermus profundus DSM 14977]|uniref:ABC transporter related protein n=1 Tax=Oceanithermus profundus (strain DSM 14977 / NBRC 100410 / VKM B-2274 / 506) TaxID=670487 RepID=E4U4I8_OCEP5|nr:ATP-binding cassette domain-containing protein [Oceanithermus profundus]ADR36981.1 ABC transporter related protein [Oceanithermus profundus DSM 14977]